jgi:DNA-3-methyladenine glycosylase I
MSGYCDIAPGHPYHGPYHESEYGFPLRDDDQLFERLCLEIFQAGLSWLIVLKKREQMREAFDGFALKIVANYTDDKIAELLGNSGIVRHRGKIEAIIENARRILVIQRDYGSFADWLDRQPAKDKADWVKIFKKTFKFTGGEIVGEFLMSIGKLPGAHSENCPIALKIKALT